jgi:hypothetical protein
MNKDFFCNKCNLHYKSQSGLWRHNNQKHNKPSYKCSFCSIEFDDRKKKYRHQIKCNPGNTSIKNIHSNNVTNSFNRNIYIINVAGPNQTNLTLQEIKEIIKSPNKTIDVIDKINFNPRLPEYHSFCCKNLNGKHFIVYDRKNKNKISIADKKEFSSNVRAISVDHIECCLDIIKDKISDDTFNNIKQFIDDTKNKIAEQPFDKKYLESLNRWAYNKRYLILDTWKQITYESDSNPEFDSDSDSDSISSDDSFYIKK